MSIPFGARVIVRAVYRRYAYGERRREWHAVTIDDREGIYIGKRSLANGEIQWDDDPGGAGFRADRERLSAALVVYNEHRNPVLVPFDALSLRYTMTEALEKLRDCGDALRVVMAELDQRDIRIAILEAAIRDTLRLHAAGSGDAVSNLAKVLDK
jgi:hypothetical protein